MIALKPRNFVNRGSVLASGFMIPWEVVGMGEARQRVLGVWRPGLQLKRTGTAFIVLLPEAVRVIAGQTIGEPLVRLGRLLVALPLEPREFQLLSVLSESLVFANAGSTQIILLAELSDEDMAQWLDTESAEVAEVVSLGARPVKPTFQVREFDARKVAGLPPAAPELQQLLSTLRQQQPASQAAQTRAGYWKRYLSGIPVVFRMLLQRIREISFRRKRSVQSQRVSQPAQRVSTADARAPSIRKNRLWEWLKGNASRFLSLSGFWRLLTLRHANYLSRMVAMFQSGDIDQGLRHAIPLSDATKLGKKRWSWFRMPTPRTNLSINPHREPAGSSWGVGGNVYQYLRDLYRQAFQRLEAQGRIEQAAFVLTELLASHIEAVSFLEKHGKLRLAAEIAEAKQLGAILTIRLWWLAKEPERALALGLRTGELERVVEQLGGSHPEEAAKLRRRWAEILASSGKYLVASEVIWPVQTDRHLALDWWNQAIDLGGTAGSIALARKAARVPESFPEVSPQVEALMADESDELARVRWAFAENLCREPRNLESQALARSAARSLIRDVQQGRIEITPEQVRSLLDHTADASLRTDVPPVQGLKPNTEGLPLAPPIEIAATDVGHHSITDLAFLPNGGLLLALGEAGLLFLSRDGRPVARVNQPAQKLVVSDDGSRAIGIAPRGPVVRLVRIEIASRTVTYWCDAEISGFTPDFDGRVWSVANGQDVFLIDTLAKGFDVSWRIPDLNGKIRAMQRNLKKHRLYVLAEAEKLTLWDYEETSCRLSSKQEFDSAFNQTTPMTPALVQGMVRKAVAISEEGKVFEQLVMIVAKPEYVEPDISTTICKVQIPALGVRQSISESVRSGSLAEAAAQGQQLAIPIRHADSVEVFMLDVDSCAAQLWLRLQGAKEIALRFSDRALLCADDRGRVVVLDLATGRTLRDLRV